MECENKSQYEVGEEKEEEEEEEGVFIRKVFQRREW